jgi:hypothetical protein
MLASLFPGSLTISIGGQSHIMRFAQCRFSRPNRPQRLFVAFAFLLATVINPNYG